MAQSNLRFALFGNTFPSETATTVDRILSFLSAKGARVSFDRTFFHHLSEQEGICLDGAEVFDDGEFEADFVLSLGGDGTFLKAASRVGEKEIPIVGVNTGRLGFLADVNSDNVCDALEALFNGNYAVENRSVICVETDGTPFPSNPCALNDIAVLKRDNASMISIHVDVNGEHLVTYQADGLIVSTPTGSTAYSLSNGGPVIVPQTTVVCLTPVAPHSLNIRPIVLPDTTEIVLNVESRSHNFLVAVDGRSATCREGTKLTIRKAPYSVKIVKRDGQKYFSTLKNKMMWGRDKREDIEK